MKTIIENLLANLEQELTQINQLQDTPAQQTATIKTYQNTITQLQTLISNLAEHPFPIRPLRWTASKIDAVELIYALKAAQAINNGQIDIAELVTLFEYIFQTDLKESYHKFTDISRRKKNIPVFLHKLGQALVRLIEDKLAL